MPFTYKQIRDMTLNRVDEDILSPDPVVLDIVKTGINQAYMLLAAQVDKRTVGLTVPFASKLVLPSDLIDIVNVSHSVIGDLSTVDYECTSDLMYIRSKDITAGTITITYSQFPVPLSADTDILRLKDGFAYALTSYGSYAYQLYRKKYSAAQLLLAEFNSFQGLQTQFTPIPNE